VGDGDALDIYMHDGNANTLYAFPETIVGRSMLESIDPADHAGAFDLMVSDSGRVIGWFNQIIAGCMIACLHRHIEPELTALGARHIEVEATMAFADIRIPYFVELPPDGDDDTRGATLNVPQR
jgi:hypothetical protein